MLDVANICNSSNSIASIYASRWLFFIWMVCEVVFLPYYYVLYLRMSEINEQRSHLATESSERMELVEKCFKGLESASMRDSGPPYEYMRKVLEGWFLHTPLIRIQRGNMLSWTGWAFFDKDVSDMSPDELQDNENIVSYIEKKAQWTFPEGFSSSIPAARLTLDPLFATQRPFVFYAAIFLMNSTAMFILHLAGFSHLPRFQNKTKTQNIYYRAARKSVDSGNEDKLPIVFIHGIGIGFASYIAVLLGFPRDVDVFLVEWPYVAMQMKDSGPSCAESVNCIVSLLEQHGHKKACFVAHSLGTVMVSWMLHDPRGASMVGSTLLMDPVTFLLCDPTVATMFVYKDPTNTLDLLMHFFLSRELYIANALSRHFAWSHNIMFVEDFANSELKPPFKFAEAIAKSKQKQPLRHTIILSSRDVIVPVEKVGKYLDYKLSVEKLGGFEVLVCNGTHGEATVHWKWIGIINSKVKDRINKALVLPSNQ